MLHLDGQVHHDTHALPMENYVIEVGITVIVSPSQVGNCKIADKLAHIAKASPKNLVDLAAARAASNDITATE